MFSGGLLTSGDGDYVITCVLVDTRLPPVRTDHPPRWCPAYGCVQPLTCMENSLGGLWNLGMDHFSAPNGGSSVSRGFVQWSVPCSRIRTGL
ncbi:Hypothetical protein CINCED_3A015301 [Cinara cedri]|uniref:Uncharacterized protein n=1 Tax=Cinara cedri TaxID=506608 RepID=A0A5E4MK54_9HEMI|nr:Hypothetical protein CINCED_3A015301 [Cinara cedri]